MAPQWPSICGRFAYGGWPAIGLVDICKADIHSGCCSRSFCRGALPQKTKHGRNVPGTIAARPQASLNGSVKTCTSSPHLPHSMCNRGCRCALSSQLPSKVVDKLLWRRQRRLLHGVQLCAGRPNFSSHSIGHCFVMVHAIHPPYHRWSLPPCWIPAPQASASSAVDVQGRPAATKEASLLVVCHGKLPLDLRTALSGSRTFVL